MAHEHDTSPAAVVRRQVEAYNDGDAEAFARYFAERAVIARFDDGEPVAEGRDEIRRHYGDLFQSMPKLHCEVTDRMTVGEFVACRELVTGVEEPFEAFAVYLVDGDVIRRLWLGEG